MARKRKKDAAEEAEPTAGPDTTGGLRLTDHPRAQRHIATVKGWAGLAGFVLGAFLASRTGLPVTDVLLRGLLAGIGAYLVAWALGVTVWRQLARAEVDHMRRLFEAAHAQAQAEADRRRIEREAQAQADAA
jgi:hypothetical protein